MKKNKQSNWNSSESNVLEDIREAKKMIRKETGHFPSYMSQAMYNFLLKMKAIKNEKE